MRDIIGDKVEVTQKRMMGGLVLMVDGHMLGGVDRDKAGQDRFMFRVGAEAAQFALARPGATQVMMGTRPMKGFVFVKEGDCDDEALAEWVTMALAHASNLPPK